VAEVGATAEEDQIYRLTYDGSVADEHGFAAMGGQAEVITQGLSTRWRPDLPLAEALSLAVELLGIDPATTEQRTLTTSQLEVAVLERGRPRRKFRRLTGSTLATLLGQPAGNGADSTGDTAVTPPDEREKSPPTTLAGGSQEPPGPDPNEPLL
jgi:proteasome alpha subunit